LAGRPLPIIEVPDFLPADACAALVACFERSGALLFRNPAGDPYWDNRYLWITSLPPAEAAAKRVMQAARRRVVAILCDRYAEAALYSDSVQLVRWLPGQAMPPHADNAHPDGSPHGTPHRDYASVVYLNDGYEGGEIYFPHLGIERRPARGLMIAFPGGMEHFHGVREVRGAARYTMPAWYTRDIRERDPSELEEL